jgi:hypothetical protein
MTNSSSWRAAFPLAFFRFLAILGAALWIGGLIFFGAVAAPVLVKTDRALLFLLVAPLLARFAFVTYVCSAFMLLGWTGERIVQLKRERRGDEIARGLGLWRAQGIFSALMLVIALYLGTIVMPRLLQLQPQMQAENTAFAQRAPQNNAVQNAASTRDIPEAQKTPQRRNFDALHALYSNLARVTVWLGLGVLFALCLRLSLGETLIGIERKRIAN